MSLPETTSPSLAAIQAGRRPITDLLDGPLVEPCDDGTCSITFAHRSGAPAVGLFLGAPHNTFDPTRPMWRLEGTDVWLLTVQAPRDLHTIYAFLPEPPSTNWDADALSGDVAGTSADLVMLAQRMVPDVPSTERMTMEAGDVTMQVSVVRGPDAPQRVVPDRDRPSGDVSEHVLTSTHLDGDRRVWLHTPPGFDAAVPHNVLVLFDGQLFRGARDDAVTTELDRLHLEGRITPTVTVMVDSGGIIARVGDLHYNDSFLAFVRDELLPWVETRSCVRPEPSARAVAGASLGGSAALYVALLAPDTVANAIALSPAVFIAHEEQDAWILGAYETAARVPQRVHMSIGTLEDFMLTTTRKLAGTLEQRGVASTYVEFAGGHDLVGWLPQLTAAVQDAFPA